MSFTKEQDAIAIQAGACNPRAIAHSFIKHANDMSKRGTDSIRQDPALRLMVHQLAFLMNIGEIENGITVYGDLMDKCSGRSR